MKQLEIRWTAGKDYYVDYYPAEFGWTQTSQFIHISHNDIIQATYNLNWLISMRLSEVSE